MEKRTRSSWGTFWRVCLVLWTLLFAFDVVRVLYRASEASRGEAALVQAFAVRIASARLTESAVVWLAGAALLGIACYATRGTRVWVPIDAQGAPSTTLPPAFTSEPAGPSAAERRGDRIVMWLFFGVVALLAVVFGLLS